MCVPLYVYIYLYIYMYICAQFVFTWYIYAQINGVCKVGYINPLKTEFLLNKIYKLSSYLTGNMLRLRYKTQPVNTV
jgi:hypothetical protein